MYVELKDINKTFGDYKASDHVSFGIEKGNVIGLLGPVEVENDNTTYDCGTGTARQRGDHY